MAMSRGVFKLPIFLAPAFAEARPLTFNITTQRAFTTSSHHQKSGHPQKPRKKKDANKERGVSALRSTGPRHKTRVYKYPLPEPAKNFDAAAAPYEINQQHGLFQFFNKNRDTLIPPNEEDAHGRAWTVKELSKKDFYDLWRLHWTCVKEANQIATRNNERRRLKVGYGKLEIGERLAEVRGTMSNIRKVLIQRHEDFSNGRMLLENHSLAEIFPDLAISSSRDPLESEVRINQVDEHGSSNIKPEAP